MKLKPPGGRPVSPLRDIRLFLSYAHEESAVVEQTAAALSELGIKPFVAARDILPAKRWLPLLESELRNSDGLVAFLTPSFRASAWSDQEVGYALGVGKKILPIQISAGIVPHGFMERYQAVYADAMKPGDIAVEIFDWLLRYDDMQRDLASVIIFKLNTERSKSALRLWTARLVNVRRLSPEDADHAESAINSNALIKTDLQLKNDITSQLRRLSEPGLGG